MHVTHTPRHVCQMHTARKKADHTQFPAARRTLGASHTFGCHPGHSYCSYYTAPRSTTPPFFVRVWFYRTGWVCACCDLVHGVTWCWPLWGMGTRGWWCVLRGFGWASDRVYCEVLGGQAISSLTQRMGFCPPSLISLFLSIFVFLLCRRTHRSASNNSDSL